jgi:uncharacterized protein
VGFILHQEAGYSYDFPLEIHAVRIGADLDLREFAGTLSVGRTGQGLLCTGAFQAEMALECARCLRQFDQNVHWTMTELYASSEKSVSESDLLIPEDSQIDLEPLMRDYALLEIPINPLCRPDCKGLCPVCGQDLNLADCGHRPGAGSSTFASLRDLLRE